MFLYFIPAIIFGDSSFSAAMEFLSRIIFHIIIGAWFFLAYPIGGYSHAAFHLVLLVPLVKNLIIVASQLDISMEQMERASCVLLHLGKL